MPAQEVLYCGVCTMPREFCDFGGRVEECNAWWTANHPDYNVEGHLAAVSLDGASSSAAPTDAAAEASSSGAPAEDDSKKSNKKKDKKSKKNAIIVTMLRRAGRNVTTVSGLERYDVDLKKASKLFSSKFACGCTTHKNPSQVLEILIQGDVSYDVAPVIMANWPNITEDDFEYIEK